MIQRGIDVYLKRLPGLAITEIRDSNCQKETKAILASLRKNEFPVALSEESTTFSSIKFANQLQKFETQRLVFIIGGADGLSSEIKNISSWGLSLSPLTFPHELSLLILLEQLYRAKTILQGTPYHRE